MAGSARSNYDIFLKCFSHYIYISHQFNHSCEDFRRQDIHRGDKPRGFHGLSNGEHLAAGASSDGKASRTRWQILVEDIATQLFMALPQDLRTMSSSTVRNNPNLPESYGKSCSMSRTMLICSSLPDLLDDNVKNCVGIAKDTNFKQLYMPILRDYVKAASQNHGSCEICQRHRLKLTEHHLIPRVMHGQFLKQGIYNRNKLMQVAWLCRGCHEFIHQRIKPNVLAAKYSSIGLLMRRHDVREWARSLRQIVRKAR